MSVIRQRLRELIDRDMKATGAPWSYADEDPYGPVVRSPEGHIVAEPANVNSDNNGPLIADARNALPDMANEIRMLLDALATAAGHTRECTYDESLAGGSDPASDYCTCGRRARHLLLDPERKLGERPR